MPATLDGIAIIEIPAPGFADRVIIARQALGALHRRGPHVLELLPRRPIAIAAADAEMMGAPPMAASNLMLRAAKLLKVADVKLDPTASRSALVPAGLNGASGLELPLQPARVALINATVMTDRFANCSTRMGSASIIGSS